MLCTSFLNTLSHISVAWCMLFPCLKAFPPNPFPRDKFKHILQTQWHLLEDRALAIHLCPQIIFYPFSVLQRVVLNGGYTAKALRLLCKKYPCMDFTLYWDFDVIGLGWGPGIEYFLELMLHQFDVVGWLYVQFIYPYGFSVYLFYQVLRRILKL